MHRSIVSRRAGSVRAPVTLAALALVATAVCGCVTGSPSATQPTGGAPAVSASAAVVPASDVQTCAECGGLGAPKVVEGTAAVENGVQVVSVAIQGGYYVPNTFTVQAGMPVKAVFTGKAKGCVAKPKFASLGKSGDVTATGSSTVDLGTLAPGTYGFTCAMGVNAGTIIVR
jgi:uncharacterized protein